MPCRCLCSAQGCTSRQAVHTSCDCLSTGSKSHFVYVGKSMSELSVFVSLPKYTESVLLWSHSNIYSIYLPLWHDCWKEGAGALLCLDPVMKKSPPGYLMLLPAITSHWDIWKGQWQFHAVASFSFKKEKAVPIELCCDQQKLNCTVLFLYACYHRHSVHVTRDLTLFILTYVQNQTPWKNEKVMTINLLQPVVLKILLCALSSWCASAIAGFPHSKNSQYSSLSSC